MKTLDLKEYGLTKYNGKDIFGYGNVRLAPHYYKYMLEKKAHGKSILDIGCGDGVIGTIVGDDTEYMGLDIGAGIYKEVEHKQIRYIRNHDELMSAISEKKVDISILNNVLEHTFDFTDLFEKALENTNDMVMVSLPNEENIHLRLSFLMGRGITSHTLDLVGSHVNHRHLWLVQIPKAEKILTEIATRFQFKLEEKSHYIAFPNTTWKKWLYMIGTRFLPWNVKARNFVLVFKKNKQ
jgi:2-polyprenyl-3-methyl-5-hydroxy-6-metoxy-1,4-benzoquinol methylase